MGLTQLVRPSLSDLRTDTFNRFVAAFGAECAQAVPSNNHYVASQVIAGLRDEDWGWRSSLAEQIIPDLSSGIYLERWASITGCVKRPAQAASGNVILTGIAGSVVPDNSNFTFCDGSEYVAASGGTIGVGGTLTLSVTAVKVGITGNRAPSDLLFTSSTIPGVNVQVSIPTGIVGGAEIETDDSLRICLRNKFRRGCTPGSIPQIEEWMQECNQEVTKTCIRDDFCGCGTVGIWFLMENAYPDTFGTPLPADIANMQACLNTKKVAGTTLLVRPIAQVSCNVLVTGLTPDSNSIRQQVTDNLEDVILRRRACGQAPCKAWFWEAVSATPDVTCFNIAGDCSEAHFTSCMIPAPGNVNFQ